MNKYPLIFAFLKLCLSSTLWAAEENQPDSPPVQIMETPRNNEWELYGSKKKIEQDHCRKREFIDFSFKAPENTKNLCSHLAFQIIRDEYAEGNQYVQLKLWVHFKQKMNEKEKKTWEKEVVNYLKDFLYYGGNIYGNRTRTYFEHEFVKSDPYCLGGLIYTSLCCHDSYREILNFLYDSDILSDFGMKAIRATLSEYGLIVYPSTNEFIALINAKIEENPEEFNCKITVLEELEKIDNNKHQQLLIWRFVQHLKESENYEHSLVLDLLHLINMRELSFYKTVERTILDLKSTNPQSLLSAEQRQLLAIKSLFLEGDASKPSGIVLKDLKAQIKYLYLGFRGGELPSQLENVTVSLDAILNLLELVAIQKRKIDLLEEQLEKDRENFVQYIPRS